MGNKAVKAKYFLLEQPVYKTKGDWTKVKWLTDDVVVQNINLSEHLKNGLLSLEYLTVKGTRRKFFKIYPKGSYITVYFSHNTDKISRSRIVCNVKNKSAFSEVVDLSDLKFEDNKDKFIEVDKNDPRINDSDSSSDDSD